MGRAEGDLNSISHGTNDINDSKKDETNHMITVCTTLLLVRPCSKFVSKNKNTSGVVAFDNTNYYFSFYTMALSLIYQYGNYNGRKAPNCIFKKYVTLNSTTY